MRIQRSDLKKTLEVLKRLDHTVSPYCGLEWFDSSLAFYRTSNVGFIRSTGFRGGQNLTIASYAHLNKCLASFISGDEVELDCDPNGHLWMRSTSSHPSEVRVHTLGDGTPWATTHIVGQVTKELDPSLFLGVEVKPFEFRVQPVLKGNKLMIPTASGIVFRHGMAASAFPYPRDVFLRAVCGMKLDRLFLTSEGYWGASYAGLDALDHAIGFAAGGGNCIFFEPTTGHLTTRDARGIPGRFSIGGPGGWPRFAISQMSAKTVQASLKQATEETVALYEVGTDRVRFERGLWEVNTKLLGYQGVLGGQGKEVSA
jgi:hypothetical protein